MSRSVRSMICAACMLALASGGAHAQTAPSPTPTPSPTTTTTTTNGVPAACQAIAPSTSSTPTVTSTPVPSATPTAGASTSGDIADDSDAHGDQVTACVDALRASDSDEHGLGQVVSDLASQNGQDERADHQSTDETSATSDTHHQDRPAGDDRHGH